MNKRTNLIPAFSGIVFLLTAVFAAAHAWLAGIHKYDMSLSFSSYVGLSRLTSIVWFIAAVIIIPAVSFYISKSDIPAVRKAVYGVVFFCIAGTALFPFNCFSESPSALTCNIHNYFAIALMLATTVSFVLSAVMAQSKNSVSALFARSFTQPFSSCCTSRDSCRCSEHFSYGRISS